MMQGLALTKCIIVTVTVACIATVTRADCSNELNNKLINVHVEEGSEAGPIWDFGFNVEAVQNDRWKKIQSLMGINGSQLYLKENLTLDGEENKDRCQLFTGLNFDLQCSSGGSRGFVVVLANFTDDYPPSFTNSSYTVHVSEENTAPVQLIQFTKGSDVTDDDCGNDVFEFYVESPSSQGGIDFTTQSTGKVIASPGFDYERQQTYTLNISVLSGETENDEGRKGFTSLIVIVDDVDDRDPAFDKPTFELTVDEETDLSKANLQSTPRILAKDGDTGINQQILYSIADSPPALGIVIDSHSGVINISSILDRELNNTYQVIIKAAQSDKPDKSALALLTIHVRDVNDHLPMFSSLDTTVSLPVNTLDGAWVMALPVSDADDGDNAKNNLSVVSDDSSAFALTNNDGITWLVVNSSKALRGKTEVHVTIQATPVTPLAQGTAACDYSTTCVTHVTVNLLNNDPDMTPKFDQDVYTFQIYQSRIGLSIGNVSRDNNRHDSGHVTYSMSSQPRGMECENQFSINNETGEIIMEKEIYQSQLCLFQVEACALQIKNSDKVCSTVPVTIQVLTMAPSYNISLREDVAVGTVVLMLPERSLDLQSETFEIQSNCLVTNETLDRETKDQYTLQITDGNENNLVSTVHIRIKDVNDNVPAPENQVYKVRINGLESKGDTLETVKAVDRDEGPNGDLSYFLLDGGAWISIEEKTGVVTLKQMPAEDDLVGPMLVSIQDHGQPPLKALVKLQITMPPTTNTTTPLILTLTRDKVINDRKKIEEKLSSIIKHEVTVVKVNPLADVDKIGSILFLTALDKNGTEIPHNELKRLLSQHAKEIFDKFKEDDDGAGDDDHLYKTLFVVVACLFAGLLFVIVVLCRHYRTRNKKQRQKLSIMSTLNKDTRIYDDMGKEHRDSLTLIKNGGSSVGRSNGISSNGPATANYEFDNAAFQGDDYENFGSSSDIYAKIIRNGSARNNEQADRVASSVRNSTSTVNDSTVNGSTVNDNWSLKPLAPNETSEDTSRTYDNEQCESPPKPYISTITIERQRDRSPEAHYKNILIGVETSDENAGTLGDNDNDNESSTELITTPRNDAIPNGENEASRLQSEPRPDYPVGADSPGPSIDNDGNSPIVIVTVKDSEQRTDHSGFDPNTFSFLEAAATSL